MASQNVHICLKTKTKTLVLIALICGLISVPFGFAQTFENTPEWISSLNSQDNWFSDVAISSDGNYIAALGENPGQLLFYTKESNASVWSHSLPLSPIDLSMTPDGAYIVAGYLNGYESLSYVAVFANNQSSPLWTYQFPSGFDVTRVAISNDGKTIAAAINHLTGSYTLQTKVLLFNTSDFNSPSETDFSGILTSLTMSSDGNYLAVSTSHYSNEGEGKIYLLSSIERKILWEYSIGLDADCSVISGDGKYLIASGFSSRYSAQLVYFFSTQSSTPIWTSEIDSVHPGVRPKISISENGSRAVISGWYTPAILFSTSYRDYLNYTFKRTGGDCNAISRDGSYAVTAGPFNKITIFKWTGAAFEIAWSATLNEDILVDDVGLSSNGRYLVAGTDHGGLILYDNTKARQVSSQFENPWFWAIVLAVGATVAGASALVIRKQFKKNKSAIALKKV